MVCRICGRNINIGQTHLKITGDKIGGRMSDIRDEDGKLKKELYPYMTTDNINNLSGNASYKTDALAEWNYETIMIRFAIEDFCREQSKNNDNNNKKPKYDTDKYLECVDLNLG